MFVCSLVEIVWCPDISIYAESSLGVKSKWSAKKREVCISKLFVNRTFTTHKSVYTFMHLKEFASTEYGTVLQSWSVPAWSMLPFVQSSALWRPARVPRSWTVTLSPPRALSSYQAACSSKYLHCWLPCQSSRTASLPDYQECSSHSQGNCYSKPLFWQYWWASKQLECWHKWLM